MESVLKGNEWIWEHNLQAFAMIKIQEVSSLNQDGGSENGQK